MFSFWQGLAEKEWTTLAKKDYFNNFLQIQHKNNFRFNLYNNIMEIIASKLKFFKRPTVNVLVDLGMKKKPSFNAPCHGISLWNISSDLLPINGTCSSNLETAKTKDTEAPNPFSLTFNCKIVYKLNDVLFYFILNMTLPTNKAKRSHFHFHLI